MLREIGGRAIGADAPVFVIAEIGLNHGGSLDRALSLVDAAAAAGASAIKLQTLYADRLVAESCPAPAHVQASSLREFFGQFELDAGAHRTVVSRARARGLAVMTTPFAEDVLPMLEALSLDAYKIASGDMTYDGLIRAVSRTGRPVVLSTGMSDISAVAHAVQTAQRAACTDLALLHCVSAYPTPVDSRNVRAVATLAEFFQLPVGLSDHAIGLTAALGAVALGATIYERHLVLDDDREAIDRAVSSTPRELEQLIAAMEEMRRSLGDGIKRCQPAEAVNVTASRRGLYATRTLRAGQAVRSADVIALRPALGLAPTAINQLIGARLRRDVAAGDPFLAVDVLAEHAA